MVLKIIPIGVGLSIADGVKFINDAIDAAERSETKSDNAVSTSNSANQTAQTAETKADSVQEQFNQVVIEGDSSVEAAQARVEKDGTPHQTLKERLDTENTEVASQLAENEKYQFKNDMISHKYQQPLLTIIDDDSRLEAYGLKTLAEEYGIPITLATITGRVGVSDSTLTLSQLKEMQSVGFEIVSHTHNHINLATITETEVISELKNSKEWLENNGFEPTTLVYPFGGKNVEVMDLARRYFRCAFSVDEGSKINYPPQKTFEMERIDMNLGSAVVKSKIDEAITNKGWITIMTHTAYPEYSEIDLRDVIEYAQLNNVDIVDTKEGLGRVGNIIDVPEKNVFGDGSVLDCNGETYGNVGAYNFGELNSVTATNPISDFKDRSVTVVRIGGSNASSTNFPVSEAGILETHRIENDSYSYQIYFTASDTKSYKRTWNYASGVWYAWIRVDSLTKIIGGDKYGSAVLYSNLEPSDTENITISKISYSNDSGYPENSPGIVTTYPFFGSGYAYQKYDVYNSHHVYKRYWDGSVWSTWKRLDFQSSLKTVTLTHVVPGNSTSDFNVNSSVFVLGDNCVANPETALPTGIMWGVWIVADGTAKIRLANVTGVSIDCGSVAWLLKTVSNA